MSDCPSCSWGVRLAGHCSGMNSPRLLRVQERRPTWAACLIVAVYVPDRSVCSRSFGGQMGRQFESSRQAAKLALRATGERCRCAAAGFYLLRNFTYRYDHLDLTLSLTLYAPACRDRPRQGHRCSLGDETKAAQASTQIPARTRLVAK